MRSALLAGTDAAAVRRGLGEDPAGFALTARQAALAQPPDLAGPPRVQAARMPIAGGSSPVVDRARRGCVAADTRTTRREGVSRRVLSTAAGSGRRPGKVAGALIVGGARRLRDPPAAPATRNWRPRPGRYLLTPMTERQLRMAVTDPAKAAGSSVDDDLVTVLLEQVRSRQGGSAGAGVLPLVPHALDQAWRSRTGPVLTLADYERTGGIEGAIAVSAERAYSRLAPGQQVVARQVFTRLTAASLDAIDTADRATRAELTDTRTPDHSGRRGGASTAFAASGC